MKILYINNYFYERGGAEKSIFGTAKLMEENGHQVYFFSVKHDKNREYIYDHYFLDDVDFKSGKLLDRIKVLFRVFSNRELKVKLDNFLDEIGPIDIVHLNNVMYRTGIGATKYFKKKGIPMVMHLRDYNLVCGEINQLNNGRPCDKCKNGHFSSGLKDRCKGGFFGSLIIYLSMVYYHKVRNYFDYVSVYIAPSEFLLKQYKKMGFNKHFVKLSNFVVTSKTQNKSNNYGDYFLYFGRLSPEKGVLTLLTAVELDRSIKLRLVGEGPEYENIRQIIREKKLSNVILKPAMYGDALEAEISGSKAVVVPSEWYENNSRSIIEGMSFGKGVIASRIGGNPEFVLDEVTGLLFDPFNANDLCRKLQMFNKVDGKILGENGKKHVNDKYNKKLYYEKLLEIYDDVVKDNKA